MAEVKSKCFVPITANQVNTEAMQIPVTHDKENLTKKHLHTHFSSQLTRSIPTGIIMQRLDQRRNFSQGYTIKLSNSFCEIVVEDA